MAVGAMEDLIREAAKRQIDATTRLGEMLSHSMLRAEHADPGLQREVAEEARRLGILSAWPGGRVAWFHMGQLAFAAKGEPSRTQEDKAAIDRVERAAFKLTADIPIVVDGAQHHPETPMERVASARAEWESSRKGVGDGPGQAVCN